MEPKDKDNKPIIPTLKASTSQKPQLKIKGLPSAGVSLIERLKQFKKKDLAFILSGLGVLFMAPLAEHFMMAPENPTGALDKNWGIKDGVNGGGFGGSHTPYEQGLNGLAPGNGLGAGDVITPLNVRDPSSLIMGPSASVQPPAGAPPAPSAPTKSESSDWKDALAQSAAGAAKAATKKAALPVPKVSLGGGTLRGLGALAGGGGGGGFGGGGAISSQGLAPNKAADSHALTRSRAATGFNGVAARGAGSGAGGGFEQLKKSAGGAGDAFNRTGGGAAGALDTAAHSAVGGGDAFGGAAGGGGGGEKQGGGNSLKDSKSLGESLEFLRMKAEQDHAIDLEWKLKEKAAMRWPNLEDKMLEEVVMTPIKGLTKAVSDSFTKGLTGGGGSVACTIVGSNNAFTVPKSSIGDGPSSCSGGQSGGDSTPGANIYTIGGEYFMCGGTGQKVNCDGKTGGTPPDPKKEGGVVKAPAPGTTPSAPLTADGSNQACSSYASIDTDKPTFQGKAVTLKPGERDTAKAYGNATQNLNYANAALNGANPQSPATNCGNYQGMGAVSQPKSVLAYLSEVRDIMVGPNKTDGSVEADNSVLGWLQTTSKNTQAILVKVTSKEGKSDFEVNDLKFQSAADAAAMDAAAKAIKKPVDEAVQLLQPLQEAQKKSDPKAVVGQKLATADADIQAATKNLAEANARLDDASKKIDADYKLDPSVAGQYTPLKGNLNTDYQAAKRVADDLKRALDLESAAVSAAKDRLAKGVDDNAIAAGKLVSVDTKNSAKGMADETQRIATAAKEDLEKAKQDQTTYKTSLADVVKPKLKAELDKQDKLYNGDKPAPGAAGPSQLGIMDAQSNFKNAVQILGAPGTGVGAPTQPSVAGK